VTALTEYQRLEGTGIWHASADEQRRDVALSLGEATLTITTFQGAPLSHWSLPAIHRINPGETPPMYAPGGDSPEVLEVTDDDMVAALERVRKSVARRQPKPGRVRWSLIAAAVLITLLAGYIWLPKALIRQASAVAPDAVRQTISAELLAEITRFAGQPCHSPHGDTALAALRERLVPDWPGDLLVLPSGTRPSLSLPNGTIVLNHDLVEDYDTPDVVAGHILAEVAHMSEIDPLYDLLRQMGAIEAARVMVSGQVKPTAITARTEEMMLTTTPRPAPAFLVSFFRVARVSATPFARALDPSGETTLSLIEADPFDLGTPAPLLSDTDWIALQTICGG